MNLAVNAALQAIIAEMIGVGGILNGAKVLPYSNQITLNNATQYGDLGVSLVPGVVPVTITWFGPSLQPNKSWGALGSECRFSITDPTQPLIVNGWAIFQGPGGAGSGGVDTLIYADSLVQPITVYDTTQIIAYVPQFSIGAPQTNYGGGTTVFS